MLDFCQVFRNDYTDKVFELFSFYYSDITCQAYDKNAPRPRARTSLRQRYTGLHSC